MRFLPMRLLRLPLLVPLVIFGGTLLLAQSTAYRLSRDHPAIQYSVRGTATPIDGLNERLESGGVRLDNIGAVAASGVDYVSVGRLMQSAPAADIGLDFELV